jgi:hypothetical protein
MSKHIEPHPIELYAVSFYEHAFYGPKLHQIELISSHQPFMAFSVGDYIDPHTIVPHDSIKTGEVWKICKVLHRISAFSGPSMPHRHANHEVCLLITREMHPA